MSDLGGVLHSQRTLDELLLWVNGSGMTSSILFAISIGNQDQMFSCIIKEKRSDRRNLFVHHCKTFPNPLNFVMISGPNYLRVFPKKPAALVLLSPGDVMDPIWEDYADGGRDELCVSPRKMWIPLEKLWEEWRGIWLCINLFRFTKVWIDTKLFHCKCSGLWLPFL